jgi:glycosyltransferase involved in cell wall biosynthesis
MPAVVPRTVEPHQETQDLEVSVVMPCLNEARTLPTCVAAALRFLSEHGVSGEVVVADNGSTDGSQDIARQAGARVVDVEERGYGSALRGGIAAARGRFVIMADADASYDFSASYPFLEKLRLGYEFVMGNRFAGAIEKGAMPFKHKLGNPVLTAIGRLFFKSPIRDFNCGMRGFSRAAIQRLDLRTEGMEFASEMVIKATILGLRIAEIPITLRKDGRERPPHLRTWSDGWRNLRFMLLFSPRWLFLAPGIFLFLLGGAGVASISRGTLHIIPGVGLDVHTMLVCGLLCLIGHQLIVFAVFTKLFAVSEGLHPTSKRGRLLSWASHLETGLMTAALIGLLGFALLVIALLRWRSVGFGRLNPLVTMREVIPAVTLIGLAFQTAFGSFFLNILTLRRRSD